MNADMQSAILGFLALILGAFTAGDITIGRATNRPGFLTVFRLIVGGVLIVLGLALLLMPLVGGKP